MATSGSAVRVTLLALAGTLAGCDVVCGGRPHCEDLYPAARAVVHLGGRWGRTRSVWADADGTIRGGSGQGSGWAVEAVDGRILLGQPDLDQVSLVDRPEGTVRHEATKRWTSRDREFGHAIATGRSGSASRWALWVGAPGADLDRGAVHLFTDAALLETDLDTTPNLVLSGVSPGDRLGEHVVRCADLTGDGEADWAFSAPLFSPPVEGLHADAGVPELAGAVFFLASEALEAMEGRHDVREVGRVWWGAGLGDGLGASLACNLDWTGDGRPDIAVGAPWHDDAQTGDPDVGAVYVLSGAQLPDSGPVDTAAASAIVGPYRYGWFGTAITGGDYDGDGWVDLAIGAPGYGSGRGRVLVYDGAEVASGSFPAHETAIDVPADRNAGDHLGRALATGDMDGDAFDDLFVGAPDWLLPRATDAGRLFAWLGSEEGWGAVVVAGEDEDHSIDGGQAFQRVGLGPVLADLDRDGNDDVILPTRARSTQ